MDTAIIRCTLVTTDEDLIIPHNQDLRLPHAHRLVRRIDSTDKGDPHYIEVSPQNDFTAEYVYIF